MRDNPCEKCHYAKFEEDSNIEICTLGHECIAQKEYEDELGIKTICVSQAWNGYSGVDTTDEILRLIENGNK